MGRGRSASRVQLFIGWIVLVAVVLAAGGYYAERALTSRGGNASNASTAARDLSASSSSELAVANKIGDLGLIEVQMGREAIAQINQMHGHNVGLRAGYIASYGGGGHNTSVWVARMDNPADAKSLIDQMTDMIRPNKPYFTDLRQVEKEGKTVFSVNSGGQKHYYYQVSNSVVWLSVDGPDPDGVLQNALAVLK
ncbi:MAG: hypothetical protein HYX94_12160 [Chloroflexi bacterium]|nr:hypothetical protein [Chloroflexota bacterium]